MRFFYFLVLMVILAPILVFAFQNQGETELHFLKQSVVYPLSLVIGAVYLLGMLSGSTLVGFLKRSFGRVT